ncbi:MAG: carboxylate-amine ligase [Maricaulaceae bacterium]
MAVDGLTLGVEEEYLLVDPESRDLARDPPEALFDEAAQVLGSAVTHEFLRCQIEIATPVCQNIADARRHLIAARGAIARVARRHGLALMAASTHPFADWGEQLHTPKPRYDRLDKDMQGAIRRMLICGMHVHVGIEDPELRVDLMNQIGYFLPHLLALSASSPFWQGRIMGMKSYRTCVWDGMPRSGLPGRFTSWGEYQRVVKKLVDAGLMEDASKIWWDARPSGRFPTLEMRITDVCTRLEDALCIAAIYQSVIRFLLRLRHKNQRWRVYPMALLSENRWLAQRVGVGGQLLDLGRGQLTAFPALVEELIELVGEDADALGCAKELAHARTIVDRGSAACRQLALYDAERKAGASEKDALKTVVDFLLAETVADVPGVSAL